MRQALDRFITGNYGEDQLMGNTISHTNRGMTVMIDDDQGVYAIYEGEDCLIDFETFEELEEWIEDSYQRAVGQHEALHVVKWWKNPE